MCYTPPSANATRNQTEVRNRGYRAVIRNNRLRALALARARSLQGVERASEWAPTILYPSSSLTFVYKYAAVAGVAGGVYAGLAYIYVCVCLHVLRIGAERRKLLSLCSVSARAHPGKRDFDGTDTRGGSLEVGARMEASLRNHGLEIPR